MSAAGPPSAFSGGAHGPTPEQIAGFKEAGIRKTFVADIGEGFGPYIMGYVFSLMMLGILLNQVWQWASWTKKERLLIKVIVWWVMFACVASSSLCVVWFYHLFVVDYGKYAQFVDNTFFPWLTLVDQTAIVACQIFNLDRAYRLNGNSKWILVLVTPFMLTASGITIARKVVAGGSDFSDAVAACDPNVKSCKSNREIIKPYMYSYFYCTVVIDGILTLAIARGLWKSKTGWSHTDALIKRIIMLTVETQLLPTVTAIAMSIQYSMNNGTYMAFMYITCQGKIPAIMLLAVLNYRFRLQREPKFSKFMSTEALVRSKEQQSKGDLTSETQSIPMEDYNAVNHDWQLPVATLGK